MAHYLEPIRCHCQGVDREEVQLELADRILRFDRGREQLLMLNVSSIGTLLRVGRLLLQLLDDFLFLALVLLVKQIPVARRKNGQIYLVESHFVASVTFQVV